MRALTSVLGKASRVPRLVKRITLQKRAVRTQLRAFAGKMSPGLYKIEPNLAWRLGSHLPVNLMQTKGLGNNATLPAFIRAGVSNFFVPPFLERIPPIASKGMQVHSQLFVSRNQSVKMFSSDKVRTVVSGLDTWSHLREANRVLGGHLPVIPQQFSVCGRVIEEPLVGAESFHKCSVPVQISAYRVLLSGLTELVIHESGEPLGFSKARSSVEFAIESTESHRVNSLFVEFREELIAFLAEAPTLPSHGDLTGPNVLINDEGPTVIDLEDFGERVFFWDALSLPIINAQNLFASELLDVLWTGAFDRELDLLFREAGLKGFRANRNISILSYVTLLLQRRLAETHDVIRRTKLVDRYFAPLVDKLRPPT